MMSGHGCHVVVVTSEGCCGAQKASVSEELLGFLSAGACSWLWLSAVSSCTLTRALFFLGSFLFLFLGPQAANLHSSATMFKQLAAAVCTVFGIAYSGYYFTNLACK